MFDGTGTPIAENICGKERTRTVLRKLLEEVPNGDAIVRRELDIHVNHIGENENCLNYAAEIDFEAILRTGSVQQASQLLLSITCLFGWWVIAKRLLRMRLVEYDVIYAKVLSTL